MSTNCALACTNWSKSWRCPSKPSTTDEELQAIREALDSAKSEAATDFTLLTKEEAERERCKLQRAIKNLEMQNRGLRENLEEYSLDFKNQEVKFELVRLQGLESIRKKFDREREITWRRSRD